MNSVITHTKPRPSPKRKRKAPPIERVEAAKGKPGTHAPCSAHALSTILESMYEAENIRADEVARRSGYSTAHVRKVLNWAADNDLIYRWWVGRGWWQWLEFTDRKIPF